MRRACASLLLVLLGLPAIAQAAAHAPVRVSARAEREPSPWSDPTTWGGRVPSAGAIVTIPHDAEVILDVSPPALSGLQIDGSLTFAERNLELTTDWIMIHGLLQIGTQEQPFTHRAVITLTGRESNADVMGMGTKVLGVMAGRLELHGRKVPGWTRLAATARQGSRQITLDRDMPWQRGDRIVIASSDYWRQHDEERTITGVSGRNVELDQPLEFPHWGTLQSFAGKELDERAEVGLLSRNITIQGDGDSTKDGFGGHVMIMEGGHARLEGVEFANMGQRKRLRRYPVHFHMDGDATGSYLRRSSIHHSFNRCVVIHGTNRLKVKGNVCSGHLGHGFFFEDGAETDNVLVNNLGLGTRELEGGLLSTDEDPATFWITNPDNTIRNNVAAGSDGHGFWYALPEHPTGLSARRDVWPRQTPLKEFSGNVAHSNGNRGLNVDHGLDEDGEIEATWYRPVSDPSDDESEPVVANFERFTGYMNRDRGIWLRGENHVVNDAILADNRAGASFASEESFLEDSLVIGTSNNKGATESWEDKGIDGRALPFFWEPEAQIIGFEFYDGRVGVRNTTFAAFHPNSQRPAGALGYLAPDAFAIHPKNFAQSVKFVDANPVYLAPVADGMDGDASKVFVDVDGSVTGTAGRAVVVDNPFLLTSGCEFKRDWNAHVCSSDYVSLMVGSESPHAIKPVRLTRGDGAVQTLMGCCDDSDEAWTSIIPNRSYEVAFNGGTPSAMRFVLWRGQGRAVELAVPVKGNVRVTRWGEALPSVSSRNGLHDGASAYFHDEQDGTLHLRLSGNRYDWEEIRVQIR